jgi:hypothetical protein
MGGERSRQGCNVSLHVAGPVSSRFAYVLDPDGYVGAALRLITHVKKESIARMRSTLGRRRALEFRSKIIASEALSEKAGQIGRPGPLGSALLAKLIQ